jgi:hypothetical protein
MKKFIFMFLLVNVFAPAAHADFEETALRRLDDGIPFKSNSMVDK